MNEETIQPGEPAPTEAQPERRIVRRLSDAALATSAPDESTLVMRMLGKLQKFDGPFTRWLIVLVHAFVIMLFVFTTKGTTMILALQPIITQWWDKDTQDQAGARTVQMAQAKATDDVVSALGGVTEAIKGLSGEVTAIRQDVNQLKEGRIADNRRIAAVVAEQAKQRDQAPPVRRQ